MRVYLCHKRRSMREICKQYVNKLDISPARCYNEELNIIQILKR